MMRVSLNVQVVRTTDEKTDQEKLNRTECSTMSNDTLPSCRASYSMHAQNEPHNGLRETAACDLRTGE